MLYGVEVAVYSEINTKHVNAVWAKSINYGMLTFWRLTTTLVVVPHR